MQERGFTPGDVRHVLAESSNAWPDGPPASKWRVLGRDLDGQRRMVVVALVGLRLTVITVVDADGTDDA